MNTNRAVIHQSTVYLYNGVECESLEDALYTRAVLSDGRGIVESITTVVEQTITREEH